MWFLVMRIDSGVLCRDSVCVLSGYHSLIVDTVNGESRME